MGVRVVAQPNGLLGIFSSIVDDFTYYNGSDKGTVLTLMREYNFNSEGAIEAAARGRRGGQARWEEALATIKVCHGAERAEEVRQRATDPCVDHQGDMTPVTRVEAIVSTADVRRAMPDWNEDQAKTWLAANQEYLSSGMLKHGLEVIDTLLRTEGHDPVEVDSDGI